MMKELRDINSHRSMDIAVMVRIVTETVCKMAARFVLSFTVEDIRKLVA